MIREDVKLLEDYISLHGDEGPAYDALARIKTALLVDQKPTTNKQIAPCCKAYAKKVMQDNREARQLMDLDP